jgi:hypothetical protein
MVAGVMQRRRRGLAAASLIVAALALGDGAACNRVGFDSRRDELTVAVRYDEDVQVTDSATARIEVTGAPVVSAPFFVWW